MITQSGLELADSLDTIMGGKIDYSVWRSCKDVLSKMNRLAVTYHRLQEEYCNGYDNPHISVEQSYKIAEKLEARRERKEQQIEKRLIYWCNVLNDLLHENFSMSFGGDPRGAVVTLITSPYRGSNWNSDGLTIR